MKEYRKLQLTALFVLHTNLFCDHKKIFFPKLFTIKAKSVLFLYYSDILMRDLHIKLCIIELSHNSSQST